MYGEILSVQWNVEKFHGPLRCVITALQELAEERNVHLIGFY
jgi:hypothetical protein